MTESLSIMSPRHRLAILTVEARVLARTCARYGVLTRRSLAELSGAYRWTRGRFSLALALAIEQGLIRELGLGFYAPQSPIPASATSPRPVASSRR
jgi:hypothetical protein